MGWMTHGVDLSAFCPECPSRMGMMLALISMTPQASAQLSTWPGSHQKNGVLTESTGYAPIYDRTYGLSNMRAIVTSDPGYDRCGLVGIGKKSKGAV